MTARDAWTVPSAPHTHDSPRTQRSLVRYALVAAVLSFVAGCSFSVGSEPEYDDAAIELIEGKLADEIGLGSLDARCDALPASPTVGTTFECSAMTSDDRTLNFVATIDRADRVDVESTNVITADGLGKLERQAMKILESEVGQALGEENFDCGDGPTLFDPNAEVLSCVLTEPSSGNRYEANIELSGLAVDSAFTVTVSSTPM